MLGLFHKGGACLVTLERGKLYLSKARVLGTRAGKALFGILEKTYTYTHVHGGGVGRGLAEGWRRGARAGWRSRQLPLEWAVTGSMVFLLYSVGCVYTD